MGADYQVAANAWRQLTAEIFGGARRQVHFSSGRRLSFKKRLKIHQLLRALPVGRFAAIATRQSSLTGITAEAAVLNSLRKRIEELTRWQPVGAIALVFEESARLKEPIQRHFADMRVRVDGREIPNICCWMPKRSGEPLLEMADWVLYSVAGQVRSYGTDDQSFTDDYCVTFHAVDPKLASYIKITVAVPNIASSWSAW
jgi:hypothetical protein